MWKYLKNRTKAIGYTFEGLWRLISKEESIQAQLFLLIIACLMGWHFNISNSEWMFQILAFGLIFCVEGLNTAIEEVCNYMQPEIHPKIKEIKDISAGAVLLSAITAFVIICIIYIPKLFG